MVVDGLGGKRVVGRAGRITAWAGRMVGWLMGSKDPWLQHSAPRVVKHAPDHAILRYTITGIVVNSYLRLPALTG